MRRNRNFSGRDGLLERIHGDLQTACATAVVPTEAVHGLGGIGKTELATEYAHRFGSDYDITWWIPAEQPTAASGALAELAGELGVPKQEDRAQMLAQLIKLLRTRAASLLPGWRRRRPRPRPRRRAPRSAGAGTGAAPARAGRPAWGMTPGGSS
jgi:hypothetical protein